MYKAMKVIDRYAVDYLTITTFKEGLFDYVHREIREVLSSLGNDSDPMVAKRLQYKGYEEGSIFWGEGVQGDRWNGLIEVKGGWADIAFRVIKGMDVTLGDLSCSRIDIQVTKVGSIDISNVYQQMRSKDCVWRGRVLKNKFHIGSDGMDSVEFGGKISEIKSILYTKELNEGFRGTRHEVRYRGTQARGLFKNLLASNNFMGLIKKIMFNRLERFPEFFERLLADNYRSVSVEDVDFDGFRFDDDKTLEGTLEWFLSCVLPSANKLLNSKYGNIVANEVGHLYRVALKLGLDVDETPF